MNDQVLLEWGMAGIEALHRHVGVLVIVDVLSFSTTVDVALARGAMVYPFPFHGLEAAQQAADRLGAQLAYPRHAGRGQYSLSPASLATLTPGTQLLLPSPNGSRLCFAASRTPTQVGVLTGCLRNAAAVARVARVLAQGRPVGVIPAGETWPDGSLRPAIEDLLGAGCILEHLRLPCSPEAQLARDAYRSAGHDLARLVRLSTSGRELVEAGYPGDVDLAVEEDASTVAPQMQGEALISAEGTA